MTWTSNTSEIWIVPGVDIWMGNLIEYEAGIVRGLSWEKGRWLDQPDNGEDDGESAGDGFLGLRVLRRWVWNIQEI